MCDCRICDMSNRCCRGALTHSRGLEWGTGLFMDDRFRIYRRVFSLTSRPVVKWLWVRLSFVAFFFQSISSFYEQSIPMVFECLSPFATLAVLFVLLHITTNVLLVTHFDDAKKRLARVEEKVDRMIAYLKNEQSLSSSKSP